MRVYQFSHGIFTKLSLNAYFILRQEELEAANGENKTGKSKYGAKKVNFTKLKKLIFEEFKILLSMLIEIAESL